MKMGRLSSVHYMHVLIIQAYMLLVVHGKDLTAWQMQDYCGFQVGRGETAGVMQLFADKLVRDRGDRTQCQVTVTPASLPGSHGNGRVLFYFTNFELHGKCSEINVTLLYGSSSNARYASGASETICPDNKTLTEPNTVFSSSKDTFMVLISWKPWSLPSNGFFELKFASYYEGKCDSSEEVIECANTRCTASEYHCHTDIFTCGTGEEEVCDLDAAEEQKSFWENLLDSVQTWAIIIAVMVGLSIAWKLFKTQGESVMDRLRKLFIPTSQPTIRSRTPSINTVEISQQFDTEEPLDPRGEEQINITLESDSSSISSLDSPEADSNSISSLPPRSQNEPTAPPSYDELSSTPFASSPCFPSEPPFASPDMTPSAPPPSAPPPSYDEFIANEDVYK